MLNYLLALGCMFILMTLMCSIEIISIIKELRNNVKNNIDVGSSLISRK